jgi:dihydrofolate synthase/folylpolyglutamate synthase
VRYNERIRLAGELISDTELAAVLEEVLDAGEDLGPSFFEVTIAAAFLAFSRTPADACVVEVGMGGRFDATNVMEPDVLAACGIAALGLDHERFLLAPEEGVPTEPMARIAFEKAGIAKKGVPLVTLSYRPESNREVIAAATRVGAPLVMCGDVWDVRPGPMLTYRDQSGTYTFPRPALAGAHQAQNAGLAIAMIQNNDRLPVGPMAIARGMKNARWPARMQRLSPGPLTGTREVWLDGGHNPQAGAMLGEHFAGQRLHLIIGMIEGKDPKALIAPLAPTLASVIAVPVPGHDWHPADAFGPSARPAPDVPSALAMIPDDGLPILIAGSLYLAGEVLRFNGELPD